ncbi:unnamed protein product [Cladocopium goreaui]|uniref:SET domain-containing protein n=1 Tax=Cladocopium goreaui TaxID=2562237 RepID=A0A9P1GN00_9DINO|nr:unnamed protein product [Cladocopium goreaui]
MSDRRQKGKRCKVSRPAGFATAEKKPRVKQQYGPQEGFASEKRLRLWLKDLGARGLDLVELGSKSGVWLKLKLRDSQRGTLSTGQKFLEIPKRAWITVPGTDDVDVEESLAAELLKEKSKGTKSKFEPYVDFLWRRDLVQHPIFWTQEEISWLSRCKEVQNAVLALQELTQQRVERLRQKLPGASEDDIRFALCLVECRAITTSSVAGAFVPVLDHFRNDSSGDPAILVGDDGLASGPMVAVALADLEPGMELRNCFDSVSNQELFTQYGEVQLRMDGEDALPEVNAYNEVPLPLRLLPEHWKGNSEGVKEAKVELLQRRIGIDLSSEAFLRLPMDAMPSGRLLPLVRFIQRPLPAAGKEAACEQLFDSLFKDCHPSLLSGGTGQWEPEAVEAPPAPANAEELHMEVQARKLAADWYENLIGNYNRMSERIQQDIHDNVLETSSSSSSSPGDFKIELAEITNAYYKAKRKDGSTGKSRKAKECRVLSSSPSEGTVVVQFLENGVRHTIPEDWIIKKTAKGADSQDSHAKRSRGLLAMALLACQGSVVEACCQLMMGVLQVGEGILESKNKKDRAQMAQELQAAWQQEYDLSQSEA